MDERFLVKIPWGVFGPGGFWAPNPLVKLPETEQYRQNIAAGYNIAAECIPDQLGRTKLIFGGDKGAALAAVGRKYG